METVLINASGLILIAAIIWWFWISKKREPQTAATDIVHIIVKNGVYTPSEITTTARKTITLRFIRKDPSPCAGAVIFNDFDISAQLDVDTATDIILTPELPGEYEFACEMAMYKGKLIVK